MTRDLRTETETETERRQKSPNFVYGGLKFNQYVDILDNFAFGGATFVCEKKQTVKACGALLRNTYIHTYMYTHVCTCRLERDGFAVDRSRIMLDTRPG